MNDLDYYKALYEQLQAQLNLIEKRFDISKFNKSKKKKNGNKSTKDYDGDGKVESGKDEYFGSKDKAIKKAIDKKKKTTLKEGTVISYGQISYGGFPRILNEIHDVEAHDRGAEPPARPKRTHDDHMQTIFQHWQQMQREGSPIEAGKFRRAMDEFRSGNLNYADDLLDFGASPTAVAGVVQTSSEYHAKRKSIRQPTDITNDGRWGND